MQLWPVVGPSARALLCCDTVLSLPIILLPASLQRPAARAWYLRHRLALCVLMRVLRSLVVYGTMLADANTERMLHSGFSWLPIGVLRPALVKVCGAGYCASPAAAAAQPQPRRVSTARAQRAACATPAACAGGISADGEQCVHPAVQLHGRV